VLSRRTGRCLCRAATTTAAKARSSSRSGVYTQREQLLLPHKFLQLNDDDHVVAFAGGYDQRASIGIDWRGDRELLDQPPPAVPMILETGLDLRMPQSSTRWSVSAGERSLDE
jgi:hypothetical protein